MVGVHQSVISLTTSQLLLFLDTPEIGPNALIGNSSSFTTGPTGASSNPTSSSSSFLPANATATSSSFSGGGPDTGAIVGGVLGGIGAISVGVIGAIYRFRRMKKASPPALVVGDVPQSHNEASSRPLLSDDGTRMSFSTPEAPIPSMRNHVTRFGAFIAFMLAHIFLHSQSQATSESMTFPKTQGVPYAVTISAEATFVPYNGAGPSLATMQVSAQSRGYHSPHTVNPHYCHPSE